MVISTIAAFQPQNLFIRNMQCVLEDVGTGSLLNNEVLTLYSFRSLYLDYLTPILILIGILYVHT